MSECENVRKPSSDRFSDRFTDLMRIRRSIRYFWPVPCDDAGQGDRIGRRYHREPASGRSSAEDPEGGKICSAAAARRRARPPGKFSRCTGWNRRARNPGLERHAGTGARERPIEETSGYARIGFTDRPPQLPGSIPRTPIGRAADRVRVSIDFRIGDRNCGRSGALLDPHGRKPGRTPSCIHPRKKTPDRFVGEVGRKLGDAGRKRRDDENV